MKLIHLALTAIMVCCLYPQLSFSQKPVKEPVSTSLAFASYGYMFPGGDLSKRFGNNSTVGLGYLHKFKGNFVLGADASFIFGNHIKEDSLFYNLYTTNFIIIDGNGMPAEVKMFERGVYTGLRLGQIFRVSKSSPNSGLLLMVGGGFMQHKIRIEVTDNVAPQLSGDYKKGYDRYCAGWQLNEFAGYFYMGEKKLVNFFAGLEFVQGWTEPFRPVNFDTLKKDRTKRFDTMIGIKIGWFIPFYGQSSDGFYY